ncbi:hypothetical protein COBT_003192, partial [Conglomerata obtusa]
MIHRISIAKFIRTVISVFNHNDRNALYGKLGNNLPETIIEIDETHIVTRRDGRKRELNRKSIWVIGAICRTTKMTRLKILRRRNKNVCENFA